MKYEILDKDIGQFNVGELNQLAIQFHNKYYPGWKVYETELPPHGRNVSWEAFVKYVAANNDDKMMNYHWRKQFHQCHICNLDYEYITHLENNSQEADFILKKLRIGKVQTVKMPPRKEPYFFNEVRATLSLTQIEA